MDFNFEDKSTYIPEWNENKKLDSGKQVVISWRYPTVAERNKIKYFKPIRFADGELINEVELIIDRDLMTKTCIYKIDNLNVNGKKIENGTDLKKVAGLGLLCDELEGLLIPKLREIDTENLK